MHLAVTTIGTSIGVGYTPWTILGVMTIMGPWLLAHWEEYHSGIMLYGNGYWGVTEANYLMIALHFFTAAVGPGVPVIRTDYAGSQVYILVCALSERVSVVPCCGNRLLVLRTGECIAIPDIACKDGLCSHLTSVSPTAQSDDTGDKLSRKGDGIARRRVGHKPVALDTPAAALAIARWPADEACHAAGGVLLRRAAILRTDMAHLRKGSLRPGRMLFIGFMFYITAVLVRWWPDIRRPRAMAEAGLPNQAFHFAALTLLRTD